MEVEGASGGGLELPAPAGDPGASSAVATAQPVALPASMPVAVATGVAATGQQSSEKDDAGGAEPGAVPLPVHQHQHQHQHHHHHHHHEGTGTKQLPEEAVVPILRGGQVSAHDRWIQQLKKKIDNFLESTPVVSVMSLITIWALFSDDVRLCATQLPADIGFEVVISICFFLFILEIILASYAKGQDYLYIPPNMFKILPGETLVTSIKRQLAIGSFYFWLDCIATLSLIFEIHWIIGDSLSAGVQTANGGSAARSGARAGRIVRIVRMVRLIRLVRLYKYASKLTAKETQSAVISNEDGDDVVLPPESRVGAALTDLTTRRVIILVLVILIIIPNLDANEENELASYMTQAIDLMLKGYFKGDKTVYSAALDTTMTAALAYSAMVDFPKLIRVQRNGIDYYADQNSLSRLRSSEVQIYQVADSTFKTTCYFDVQAQSQQDAQFAIFTTIFVIFILVVGTLYFSSDVQRLVIGPIEKMVDLVQKISANPLGVEYKMMGEESGFVQGMETTVLLTTITKIGGLMRVGFGEAGADVIAKNLNDGVGGQLNLMGGGSMITSIFGFCDVRQFTDTTECLQEEVMLFVNRIAHILHNIVVQCSGSANKNIGDAFLLTWKVGESFSTDQISHLADSALYAFLKTLVELNRYATFICNFSTSAMARLYKRFPNYTVRIGSGLHVGWAIEGAIGSHRKIDASYLSPHVNMTEFLESSTKAYGVPLLLSEPFYKLLSIETKKYIRQVDRIRKSEKDEPMGIYVYDADINIDFSDALRVRKHLMGKIGLKSKIAQKMFNAASLAKNKVVDGKKPPSGAEDKKGADHKKAAADVENTEEKEKEAPTIKIVPYSTAVWELDDELIELRHNIDDKFRSIWGEGINAYIKGDWRKARDIFHETSKLGGGQDGPSQFLIEVIDHHGGSAPNDWKGYRDESAGGH